MWVRHSKQKIKIFDWDIIIISRKLHITMQTTRRLPHSSWNAISEKKPQKNTFNDSHFKLLGFLLRHSRFLHDVFFSRLTSKATTKQTNKQKKKKTHRHASRNQMRNSSLVVVAERWWYSGGVLAALRDVAEHITFTTITHCGNPLVDKISKKKGKKKNFKFFSF